MVKVLFICLGNICRSPMAEFVFKHIVKNNREDKNYIISSAATSNEAVGCSVHIGTKRKLNSLGIKCDSNKRAVQLIASDYEKYDYIICMEQRNIRSVLKITGGDPLKKIFRLCDFTDNPRDIADPWYTGNFDLTYDDINDGCKALAEYIRKRHFS